MMDGMHEELAQQARRRVSRAVSVAKVVATVQDRVLGDGHVGEEATERLLVPLVEAHLIDCRRETLDVRGVD